MRRTLARRAPEVPGPVRSNPTAFWEIEFAFANNKPTILIAREGVKLPFDVNGHRCIRYKSIVQLRDKFATEIAALKAQGVLVKTV